jgi:DNA-binding CsgD family transcriptional regulator
MPPDSSVLALYAFGVLMHARSVSSMTDLNDLFAPAFRRIGFESFAAFEVVQDGRDDELAFLFGEPLRDWYDYYRDHRLATVDPRLRHCLASTEPFLLSDLPVPVHPSAGTTLFYEGFRGFGLAESYIHPVHQAEGRLRCLLLSSEAPILGDEARVAADALTRAYYTAGARLQPRPERVTLQPRQLECLYWASLGKSSSDIGQILGISSRTVDEHLSHACDRLGVRTRAQAIARSVQLGLIDDYAASISGVARPQPAA